MPDVHIDYQNLLELMRMRHHSRKSVAQAIGLSGAAYGRYISKGLPMPGDIVIDTARVLDIEPEDYGMFFFNGNSGTTSDQLVFVRDELTMMKVLLIMKYTELPQHLWDDARRLYTKIDEYMISTRVSKDGGERSVLLQMPDMRRLS